MTKHKSISLPGPVSMLPFRNESGFGRVEIEPMTAEHAFWWHTNVQSTIDSEYRSLTDDSDENAHKKIRTDIGWDWELYYWLLSVHNFGHLGAMRAPAMGLVLIAVNERGEGVLVGMATLVPRYLCNSDKLGEKTYLWFLASAPSATYDQWLDGKALDGVGKSLVDAVIQESYKVGANGAVLLHADPAGGKFLTDTYEGLGFVALKPWLGPITLFRWRNRKEYMLLGPARARKVILDNDIYRRKT